MGETAALLRPGGQDGSQGAAGWRNCSSFVIPLYYLTIGFWLLLC